MLYYPQQIGPKLEVNIMYKVLSRAARSQIKKDGLRSVRKEPVELNRLPMGFDLEVVYRL
jgi:hypothetical protein